MPNASKPRSKPSAERPSGAKGGGADDPLAAYRQAEPTGTPSTGRGQREPSSDSEKSEREQRDKVSWGSLAGIPNLRIVDSWTDENEEYGPYCGTVIRLPKMGSAPEKDVLALTSEGTRAGKFLFARHAQGKFDLFDGSKEASIGVTVRAKKSPNYPDGNPMVLLALTE